MLFINRHFSLFIFLTLFSELLGSSSLPRSWIGRNPHKTLIINEGDVIEVTCHSAKPVSYIFPNMQFFMPEPMFITSNFTISQDKGSDFTVHIFRRPKAVYGDTGFYGCFDKNTIPNTGYQEGPKLFNLTYIFVKSNKSVFVNTLKSEISGWPKGGNILIKCRTTSPDVHVDLEYHYRGNRKILTSDERVFWEPKFGFTIQNGTIVEDDGLFICKANDTQENMYSLFFTNTSSFDEPEIYTERRPNHIERGTSLSLNCSVYTVNVTNYDLKWITPRMDKRVTNKLFYFLTRYNKTIVLNELTVTNVTDDDEGYYKCNFIDFGTDNSTSEPKIKSVETYIKVFNPSMRFINLYYNRAEKDFIRHPGDDLLIIVEVDAYPEPKIQWINPKGDEITNLERFQVIIAAENFWTGSKTVLLIRNVELRDTGMYSLRVSTEEETKTMNFTLKVKPL